jgi:hypothetical protein
MGFQRVPTAIPHRFVRKILWSVELDLRSRVVVLVEASEAGMRRRLAGAVQLLLSPAKDLWKEEFKDL